MFFVLAAVLSSKLPIEKQQPKTSDLGATAAPKAMVINITGNNRARAGKMYQQICSIL